MTKISEDDVAKAASVALNTESAKAVNQVMPIILAIAGVLVREGLTTQDELERVARRIEPELEQVREEAARKAVRRELEDNPGLALMIRLFGAIK